MSRRSSRSPRRLDFQHPALAAQNLSTDKPDVDSTSWKLWLASHDLAQLALATHYIQGIKNGNLHPDDYGQYTVQDAAYCYNALADYLTIQNRARDEGLPNLASFAAARAASYESYNQQFLNEWHITSGDAVKPGEAARTYIQLEHNVAQHLEPIYGVIAMLPCDELWPWLATELKPHHTPENVYGFWIQENGDWHGAYRLDNFIDTWFATHPETYNWELALYVMRSCMTCEVNFFRSACGQDLLAMPEAPVGEAPTSIG